MKQAVMYGAGNIGRGFIGALLSRSGYEVTFIEIAKDLVARINAEGRYTVRVLSRNSREDQAIFPVRAVDGNDLGQAARAIADAELMATAVGANILKFIAPVIAGGIKLRLREGKGPLNIVICENLMDADCYLRSLLKEHLTEDELAQVGLVEASIGRMVPVQTEEMRAGDPLRICVEGYGFLPVDRDAFIGPVPDIKSMIAVSPFRFTLERKLYVHNMGHAVCAYLGLYAGKSLVADSIGDPAARLITACAMEESALALMDKYAVPARPLMEHISDLIFRFGNAALGDTCRRVGGDIPRKLAQSDRLIGAALNVYALGRLPAYICAGIAAALWYHLNSTGTQGAENAAAALYALAGLDKEHPVALCALELYAAFRDGQALQEILARADALAHPVPGNVV
jgi:mannitol-1-phosphate 5-dehydrogenase